LDNPPKIITDDKSKKMVDSSLKGDIEFKNVSFTYPARPDNKVLDGFDLKIPRNKKTALVGESGCGKSTLMQLIERFYDVDQGELIIDGLNIKEYNIKSLR
jgi:ATP-binding cassette subfamily B (MDR/TAP) protein 1